jgi:hypothetical protein
LNHDIEAEEYQGISLNLYDEISFDYLEMYYENILVSIYNSTMYYYSMVSKVKAGLLKDFQAEHFKKYVTD